jgi:DNA modification methylase
VKKITDLGGRLYNSDGCRLNVTGDGVADFVFTCPPYHQVEQYESVEGQLSDIKDYSEFLRRISVCAGNIFRVLKPGKFLCWVCGDWRAKGKLVPFHADCIRTFRDNGFELYDIVVIHNNSPFVFAAVSRAAAKRITCKVHEFLLVFRKPLNDI